MGNIACKCNKQQDHSELDLNKDKQELLKSIQTKDQNSPIDNFISDQNKHSVHSQRENLNEQANNHDLSKNGSANFKDDNNPKSKIMPYIVLERAQKFYNILYICAQRKI